MNKTIKPVLELIRLPGMFTAHADILAGLMIAGVGLNNLATSFLLILATSCFLSAGMALNVIFLIIKLIALKALNGPFHRIGSHVRPPV